MAPPKVTTRHHEVLKWKINNSGLWGETLPKVVVRIPFFFFYFCYVCCCCNNSAVDGTPLGLVYGASHQAKINRFKYGCISISSDFLISHQFCYNSKERRRRGCLSPPIILAGGVRFPVKNHSKKSIKKEKDLVWLLKGFFGFCMWSFMRLGFVEKSLHIIYESVLNACFVLISVLPTL